MHVMGIVGWKNSGKTTLVVELVKLLTARGLKIGTIKHAHHSFDIDQPGKDSYRHREAGATDVIVASGARWAQVHELRGAAEPELEDLLPRISPEVDLVLVEGFKRDLHVKIEVVPAGFDGTLLALEDPNVVAIASDAEDLPEVEVPVLPRSDPAKVADFILEHLGLV
ncbi:MAG: molybdopterin-guanine dinucleotide biosynthesis protein B [Alphaproteobacteria bacterium]|nr:molybdopterin-guanine dinucleotide biosynthesis protein B [Alphaproteobacteria bacterium]